MWQQVEHLTTESLTFFYVNSFLLEAQFVSFYSTSWVTFRLWHLFLFRYQAQFLSNQLAPLPLSSPIREPAYYTSITGQTEISYYWAQQIFPELKPPTMFNFGRNIVLCPVIADFHWPSPVRTYLLKTRLAQLWLHEALCHSYSPVQNFQARVYLMLVNQSSAECTT